MQKHTFTALIAACTMALSLCGCNEKKSSDENGSAPQPAAETVAVQHDDTSFDNGTYSGTGFSLYADPRIWAYKTSDDDPCDLHMITDKDIVSCGISVYISDDDHGGKTAQEIVASASEDENIIFSGPLVIPGFTFYFYEWNIAEETNGRMYFADHGDKYICIYAESTNFGFVDVKITDLLSTLKVDDTTQEN